MNSNSPNRNRIKKSNELRRSIQALGAHRKHSELYLGNSISRQVAHLEDNIEETSEKKANNGFIIQPDLDSNFYFYINSQQAKIDGKEKLRVI